MKKTVFWIQLALALAAVFGLLAIVQGMLVTERSTASAYATEICTLEELDPALVAQGKETYAQHCAACHGAQLEGAPDWQTPLEDGSHRPLPLNSAAHAWQHSDSALLRTITEGRNAGKLSSMPAFGETLSQQEIRSLVEFLKSSWGETERVQQQLLNDRNQNQ